MAELHVTGSPPRKVAKKGMHLEHLECIIARRAYSLRISTRRVPMASAIVLEYADGTDPVEILPDPDPALYERVEASVRVTSWWQRLLYGGFFRSRGGGEADLLPDEMGKKEQVPALAIFVQGSLRERERSSARALSATGPAPASAEG